MKSTIARQPDGTIQLGITIPVEEVLKVWEEVVAETAKNAQVEGFRKGKAPKKIVEERIDKEKVKEEVLKKLLPQTYVAAIQEHNIQPLINPRIHVGKIEDPTTDNPINWEYSAVTCEVPNIQLGNYKENIQKVTAKSKIVIPGKEPEPAKFEDIVKALIDNTEVTIPKLLIDQEVEKLLAQLLDDIKKLGLTLDQYLASTNRTPQALREEYEKRAENDIKLEFALQKVAELEKITVEEKEIDEAILKTKDENERKYIETNRYLLANILRQQKTLDFLRNL